MRGMVRAVIFVRVFTNVCTISGLFDQNADSIFEEVLGDINIEKNKWTTPSEYKFLRNKLALITESTTDLKTTTMKTNPIPEENTSFEMPNTIKDLKTRKRIRDAEAILNERKSAIPDFERGDDDSRLITRRFDTQKNIGRQAPPGGREQRRINFWRNKTITIMEHFIYATRYKLVFSQVLRKKYYNVLRYRIGYCFGLLGHLKRQQLMLYTTLKAFRILTSRLHMHMRFYEKIVRLDVDIKDVIRITRTLEQQRRLAMDPNYYDLYEEDEKTSTTRMRLEPAGRHPLFA